MSKRLLLKSVLLVSTVAPVMAYATEPVQQNPEMITQGTTNKTIQHEDPNAIQTSTQNPNNAASQNLRPHSPKTKAEDAEEMD